MKRFADQAAVGVLCGVCAQLIWGFLPLFMKMLITVPATEILAHRVLWSVALLALIVVAMRRGGPVLAALRDLRLMRTLAATSLLIAVNWLIYIWGVNAGRVIETSLGYFILPILHVALGTLLLKERLRPLQACAVGLAVAGVALLSIAQGGLPWIALALAVSFGFYGFFRKLAPVDALTGLLIETAFLTPFALGFILWVQSNGQGHLGVAPRIDFLLLACGVVTAAPLLFFAAAARRLRLSTLGLLQYLGPTVQFLLAVLWFDEPFTTVHVVTFSCIWLGIALYMADTYRGSRPAPAPAE